jgi:nucleoside-diphosphate-sugar epimerase
VKRALIIGCGYTGTALAHRLLAAGITVSATSSSGGTLAGASLARVDLMGPDDLDLPQAEGAVVYYMVPTLARVYDEARRPHLFPLERALAALSPYPLAGLIYLSSTSVYGDRDGGWVDETTPPAPLSPWGRMRLDLEERIVAYGERRSLPICVVRLPEIYGPGRGPVDRLRRGYVLRFPERYSNRIHLEDLVETLFAMGRRLDVELLLASDNEPARAGEVYRYAAERLGLDPVPVVEEEIGDPNRLALLRDSKRCRNARLLSWLGRPLRYPTFREGIAQLIGP